MCREVLRAHVLFTVVELQRINPISDLSAAIYSCYLLCLHMLKNSLSPSETPSIWALQFTMWRLAAVALWIAKNFTKSKSKCLKL